MQRFILSILSIGIFFFIDISNSEAITLAEIHDGCNSVDKSRSAACVAAMHRFCVNADHGKAGVSQEVGQEVFGVACFNSWYGEVPLSDLKNLHDDCDDLGKSQTPACLAAVYRWCNQNKKGEAGIVQEVGNGVFGVACYPGSYQKVSLGVLKNEHSGCNDVGKSQEPECVAAMHRWCTNSGHGNAGLSQEVGNGVFGVACFDTTWYGDVNINPPLPVRSQINNYFLGLPTWVSKNPINESPPSPDPKVEVPVVPDQVLPDETAESKKRRYSCTRTPYTLAKSPTKIVTFSPDAGKLWLGTLLQGNGYINGLGSLKELPIRQRAALVIWIDLLGLNVSRTVPDPSGATVQEAIGDLIDEAKSRNTSWGSSISYEKRESSSTDEFALKAGISVKYLAADVKAKLDISQKADEKTVQAYFIQKAFTVSMVTPPTPADFFSTGFTKASLDEQIQLARIGPENLPVYVSNITFGRILIVSITSRASISDISATLDATYKGAVIEANANLDAKSKKILNEATINVASIGGNDAAIVGLIKSGDLYKYFDVNSDLAVMKPISYQVDNMGDGSAARFTETINYNLTECLPLPNKKENAGEVIRVKITRGFVQNSRAGGSNNTCWEGFHRGAEVYGELSVNNTKVWDIPRDEHKSGIQPGSYFDIEYIQDLQSTLPSDDDLYPKNPPQENELAFLKGQEGSVRIVGKIGDFNNIGGDPLNVYDQSETYPFEYGTKQISAGSTHCPIDLEYEIVKVRDLYRYVP